MFHVSRLMDILEENVFQYFHGGGLVQQLDKDKRRAERNSAREQFISKQAGILLCVVATSIYFFCLLLV